MDFDKIMSIIKPFVDFLLKLLKSVGVINEDNEDLVNQYVADGQEVAGAVAKAAK